MKVLLTGANGQLGHCFRDIFPVDWQLISTDKEQLNITDSLAVDAFIFKNNPDAIVNAAAYTAVDNAEDDYELANKINVLGPKNLAISAKKYNAKLIHISTDYVFDGTKKSPYLETDSTNPINVYGRTKRDGESIVLQYDSSSIVIRTSWVFSEYGKNFVKTMLQLSGKKEELSIVEDQIGNPTYAGDIAKMIIAVLTENINGGIYHYCGNNSTSWYLFANQIFKSAFKLGKINRIPRIYPTNTESFPTKAKRPLYSVLDMKKLKEYNLTASNWKKQLDFCISKIDLN
ncbi:dTDP-4-dehydrorhamnose reductase [Gilliamella sp. B2969]|uniref:dTDP-4-dehydrorhamnose reductase n=1 Tax=Gilliamella sp. B2969 TaxID=2818021 RepID=UPI00226A27DD|nr:dTDP-4-dehydrorhamnose reductase [Gilliamella sp. B2969]MCX8729478.1 dTDP-4-dehydrorhamnose reductase [Gilliamella sp. B2969]